MKNITKKKKEQIEKTEKLRSPSMPFLFRRQRCLKSFGETLPRAFFLDCFQYQLFLNCRCSVLHFMKPLNLLPTNKTTHYKRPPNLEQLSTTTQAQSNPWVNSEKLRVNNCLRGSQSHNDTSNTNWKWCLIAQDLQKRLHMVCLIR